MTTILPCCVLKCTCSNITYLLQNLCFIQSKHSGTHHFRSQHWRALGTLRLEFLIGISDHAQCNFVILVSERRAELFYAVLLGGFTGVLLGVCHGE